MSVFLIDFENVHSPGLSGIDKLSEKDTVYIFYSANSDSLSFQAHQAIMASNADIHYMSVSSGMKNALDFHLDSFLGYLVAVSPDRSFVIISADNGYSSVKSFWSKTADIQIRIFPSVGRYFKGEDITVPQIFQESLQTKPVSESNNETKTDDLCADSTVEHSDTVSPEIKKLMDIFSSQKISKDIRNNIIKLAKSSTDKQQFYTGMTKSFGMEKGLHLYKLLRPEYANIKKLPKSFTKNN